MQTPRFGAIRQTAYIVADIEAAIEAWGRQMNVGPFALCREIAPLAGASYRGVPTGDVVMNVAFAYVDDLQLELIEQVNDTPSMYLEAIEARGYGHHHYGFCVPDFDAAYQQAVPDDFEAIVEAGVPGYARMSYIQSRTIPGLVCEVIEWNALTRPYFDGMQEFLSRVDDARSIHEIDLAAFVAGAARTTG